MYFGDGLASGIDEELRNIYLGTEAESPKALNKSTEPAPLTRQPDSNNGVKAPRADFHCSVYHETH